ncbi:hypothetical protein ARMGADRAFT_575676 [Armillaria gallica]|uniref:Uncharacterized protein n=1 Tax=Armillaria gallica TaxID=47427 RepID=A0A2H3EGA2_ARMGA|nr:hypothetical protein ARMGADRAFT_575676 [Armillaria gallica]
MQYSSPLWYILRGIHGNTEITSTWTWIMLLYFCLLTYQTAYSDCSYRTLVLYCVSIFSKMDT